MHRFRLFFGLIVVALSPMSAIAGSWASGSSFVLPVARTTRDIAVRTAIEGAFVEKGALVYEDESRVPVEPVHIDYELFDRDRTVTVYVFVAERLPKKGYGVIYGVARASRTYRRDRDAAYASAAKEAALLVAIGGVDRTGDERSTGFFEGKPFLVSKERRASSGSDQMLLSLEVTVELLLRGAEAYWSSPRTAHYELQVGGERNGDYVTVRVRVTDPNTSRSLVVAPVKSERTYNILLSPSGRDRNRRAAKKFQSEVKEKLDWIATHVTTEGE